MLRGPFLPTLTVVIGIVVSSLTGAVWWCGCIPIMAALVLYVSVLRAYTDPVAAFRAGRWHPAWVALLFAGIGMISQALSRPCTIEECFGGVRPSELKCEVTGILAKTYGDRIDVLIPGTNGARARIRCGVSEVSVGDIILIPSKYLREISKDTTAFAKAAAPMMQRAGILYTGRISPQKIKVIGKAHGLRYWFAGLREAIETKIEQSHLSKSTSDFLNAILMGDKTGLDEETRMTFAGGGTAHMLALSGLHIAILSGFILFLLWPLNLTGRYKLRYAISLLLLWIYVFLTGMSYSAVRACVMTTFVFISIIAERKNQTANALCCACLLILIADPMALFDAGFQLSVVCVGSLIAFATPLNPIGRRHHPKLHYVCGLLITAITATAASWVLTSYYFAQIPLMFIPANVLLLPLLPFYMAFAVAFVVFLCIGIEMGWMVWVLDKGYDFLLWSIENLSGGTEFVLNYQMPLWGVAGWMFMLAGAAFMLNKKSLMK